MTFALKVGRWSEKRVVYYIKFDGVEGLTENFEFVLFQPITKWL